MKKNIRNIAILIMISFIFIITGCGNAKSDKAGNGQASGKTAYPMTITDDLNNKITVDKEPEKVVSLAPSCTEIIYAIGKGDELVGRSESDNYPDEAKKVSVVGGFTGANIEMITKADPDILFAANGTLTDEQKTLLQNSGVKIILFNPTNIDGVYKDIKIAGQVLNAQEKAGEIVNQMQIKRQEIIKKVKDVSPKKVFVDLGNFYSVGENSFIGSMLSELKAENIASKFNGEWPQLSVESVVDADPDVYISLYPTIDELKSISGLSGVKAFKNGNVKVIPVGTPENDIVQRPGPRIIEGLEIYAKAIYPEVFK